MNLSHPQKLKLVFAATVVIAAGIEGTVLAQHHRAPAGRDAFLNYQVDSTDELVATLKNNKTLRQRYARHFGISEDRVIEFVKNALVPYRVPQNCVVTDHGVTKSGRIYPVKVTLKKGTRVWATRSGLPILKWACANPLAKTMPGTLMAARPKSTPSVMDKATPELASSFPSPILAPMPDAGDTAPELATPDTVAVDTSALTLPPALTGAGSASVPSIAAAPFTGSTGGKRGPGAAPLLIPAAILAATSGGGGGTPSRLPTDSAIITPTKGTTDTAITTPTGSTPTGNPPTTTPTDTTGGTPPSGGGNSGGPTVPPTFTDDNGGGSNGGTTNTGSGNTGNGGTNAGGDNSTGGTNAGGTNAGGTNTSGGTNAGGDNSAGNGGTTGGGNSGGSPTVPEPGTLALFAAAGLPALAAARKRFAKK